MALNMSSASTATEGGEASLYEDFARGFLLLVTFLFEWLTATPFLDLSDRSQVDSSGAGNFIGQVAALAVTVGLCCLRHPAQH